MSFSFGGTKYRRDSYVSLSEASLTSQPLPGTSRKKSLVIVGVDWSRQAFQTFNWYLDHLNKPDHEVLLVHVADPPYVSSEQAMYMSQELWEEMLSKQNERLLKLTNKYAARMRLQQVSGCFRAVFHKNVADALVEEAKEEKACMIVVGNRGTSETKQSVLGNVSNYVLHNAHCPVMICNEGQPEDSPTIRDKVLVYF